MDQMETLRPSESYVTAITLPTGEIEKRVNLSGKRVFGSLADFYNRLPFAGKLAITLVTTAAVGERNPYYKTVKTIEAGGYLGLMVIAHTVQAGMGISRLQQNLEQFSRTQSPESLLACSIDVAYTAVNCAATYVQLHLSGRLAEHFMRRNLRAVPRLQAWGINDGEVDYNQVAEKLMTAIVNNDQGDIDTFFMILPKEKKQKAMESIRAITDVVDETYSYEEVDRTIAQLGKNIESKSRARYIFDIVKNAHKNYNGKCPYSFKERMTMFVAALGGQMGFLCLG